MATPKWKEAGPLADRRIACDWASRLGGSRPMAPTGSKPRPGQWCAFIQLITSDLGQRAAYMAAISRATDTAAIRAHDKKLEKDYHIMANPPVGRGSALRALCTGCALAADGPARTFRSTEPCLSGAAEALADLS